MSDLSEKNEIDFRLFRLRPQTATKINSFLQSKKEKISLYNINCFAKKPYIHRHIKTDRYSELCSTFLKIESGFKKIIGHNLAGSFLYDSNHPEYPNLSVIERKVNLHRYHTIYQFGSELRNCFDFYFKLYSDSPDNYIRTYYICEFCEATLKEIEAMPKKIFDKNYMGIPEKAKLVDDITKLNPMNLKKIINMLREYISESNKENQEKVYEFDIEQLSNDKLIKLRKLVEKSLSLQEAEAIKDLTKEKMNPQEEIDNIIQLKRDLGFG